MSHTDVFAPALSSPSPDRFAPDARRHSSRPLPPWWPALAVVLQVTLWVAALAAVVAAVATGWRLLVLADWRAAPGAVSEQDLDRFDLVGLLTLPSALVLLVCGPLFVTWLFVAHRSDRMHGYSRHGSGWAIGGWFVPVLNLWRPLQMVQDVHRRARPLGERGPSRLVIAWWVAFVASHAAARVSGMLWGRFPYDLSIAELARRMQPVLALDVVAALADVAAAVLALLVVHRVTQDVLGVGAAGGD